VPILSEFTTDYLIQYIQTKLGYPVIAIELEEPQYLQCIEDATEEFQKYRPIEYMQCSLLQKGVHLINPPTNSIGLLDLDYSVQQRLDNMSVEANLLYDPFYFISSGAIGGIDIELYDLTRRWMETVGRVFGAEFDYQITDDGLFIYAPYQVKATIKWAMPYESLANVRREYQNLFKKLAVAKAKQILALIRSKYSSVPAAGGSVQLDGERLREEGKAEEDTVLDELRRTSPYYIPSYG
jgi:hypothetical protein